MVITDHRQGLGDLAQSAAGHGPNGGPLRGSLGHGALRHGLLKGTGVGFFYGTLKIFGDDFWMIVECFFCGYVSYVSYAFFGSFDGMIDVNWI